MAKLALFISIMIVMPVLAQPVGAQTGDVENGEAGPDVAEPQPEIDGTEESETDPGLEAADDQEQIGRAPEEGYADPLVGEGGSVAADGEALEGDGYVTQPQYQPPAVLSSEVSRARETYNQAQAQYEETIEIIRGLKLKRKTITSEINQLDSRSVALLESAEQIRVSTEARAVADYVLYHQERTEAPAGSAPTIAEQMQQHQMDSLLRIDSQEIDAYNELRSEIDVEVRVLKQEQTQLSVVIDNAEQSAVLHRVERDQAQIEFEAFSAGSQVFISGVVFPVSGPVNLPLIDSFGFPRMPGTPDAHWHEGIDIFAPRGTPLVATESGVVTRIGVGRLGGLKLWLNGDSGVEWYYAHLADFAPGLAEGQIVQAGDLLGYVGDTGNAVGTPPHLHMELHPGGSRPINPYPLLAMVARTEQQAGINAFSPEAIHEPLSSVRR